MVLFPEGNGMASMIERVLIRPLLARIGPITLERKAIKDANPLKGKYETAIDAEYGTRRARRPAAAMIS